MPCFVQHAELRGHRSLHGGGLAEGEADAEMGAETDSAPSEHGLSGQSGCGR